MAVEDADPVVGEPPHSSGHDTDELGTLPPGFEAYAAEPTDGVPAGSPGKDGLLRAEFGQTTGGRTDLTYQYTRVPYHLGRQLEYDEPFAAIRIQSPTAGIGQGDRLDMKLTAGPEAYAHVSSASATKVFGMDADFGQSKIRVRAESGAYVELVPEPTILHADSRFHQPVELSAAETGAIVYGDVVVPGRLARGERFEFDRYANVVSGVDPSGLAFRDAVDVGREVADGGPDTAFDGPGVFGPYSVLGTLYVLAPDADTEQLSDRLHDRVTGDDAGRDATDTTSAAVELGAQDDRPDPRRDADRSGTNLERTESPPVTASASTLPRSGVIVRALGETAPVVTRTLSAARDEVRRELVGHAAPEPRRW